MSYENNFYEKVLKKHKAAFRSVVALPILVHHSSSLSSQRQRDSLYRHRPQKIGNHLHNTKSWIHSVQWSRSHHIGVLLLNVGGSRQISKYLFIAETTKKCFSDKWVTHMRITTSINNRSAVQNTAIVQFNVQFWDSIAPVALNITVFFSS